MLLQALLTKINLKSMVCAQLDLTLGQVCVEQQVHGAVLVHLSLVEIVNETGRHLDFISGRIPARAKRKRMKMRSGPLGEARGIG